LGHDPAPFLGTPAQGESPAINSIFEYMSRTIRAKLPPTVWDDTNRDKKKGYKPPKVYKQIHRQEERAKTKQALIQDKEMPRFRKRDVYEYL
jgi:hypothetical protein